MMGDDKSSECGPMLRPGSVQELLSQPDSNTYYVSAKEMALRKRRELWHKNKEKNYDRMCQYRAANKIKIKERNRRYQAWLREEHPLIFLERRRAWHDYATRRRAAEKAQRQAANARRIEENLAVTSQVAKTVKSKKSLDESEFHRRILAIVPRSLSPDRRDDLISEVTLAFLSGEIGVDEIPARAERYVKRALREARYGLASLDEGVGTEDGTSLLRDTISRGLWD